MYWANDVKYMDICIKLIDKLWPDITSKETSYESEYTLFHETKYHFKPHKDDLKEMVIEKVIPIGITFIFILFLIPHGKHQNLLH